MTKRGESMSTSTARYAGVLARASLLPLSMLLPLAAAAQSVAAQGMPDGMIVIPGNGEPGAASSRGAKPGTQVEQTRGVTGVPVRSADADAAFENAARNAQIVIPGNGEPGAPGAVVGQAPRTAQNNRSNMNVVTINPTADRFSTQRVDVSSASTLAPAGNTVTADTRPAAPSASAEATEPHLHPAVAALLAEHSTEPAAPRSALVQLQKQAATELGQNAAARGSATEVQANAASRGAAADTQTIAATRGAAPDTQAVAATRGAAPDTQAKAATRGNGPDTQAKVATRGATSDSQTGAKADRPLSLANAPTARSMPALDTIPAGQIVGAVRPPGSRVQSVVVNRPARNMDVAEDTNGTHSAPGAQAQAATPSNVVVDSATGAAGLQRVSLRAPGSDPATGARDAVQAVTPDNTGSPGNAAGDAPRAQPKGPKEIQVNVVTNVPTNAPPIAHSVVVAPPPAAVAAATAAPVLPGKQDPAVIMKTAEDFLRQQAVGLPGRVTLSVPPIAPRGLAACDNLQAFMAPGAPMWGRTTVGVRCTGAKPWTIYLLARVSVQATYYVAGRSFSPGDVIQMVDLVPREGDLSVMPRAIVTDPAQVVGAVVENRISAGLPLRSDLVRSPQAIQMGQTVKVVAQGDGFSISTDGNAMNNAGPGEQVRVKTSSGQTVVGTASGRGVVQIPM